MAIIRIHLRVTVNGLPIVALSGAMWPARHPGAHRPAPRFSGWASGVPMTSVFGLDIGHLETRQVAQVSLVQVSNAVVPVLCSSLRARAGSCPFWKRLVLGIVPQGRFYVQVGLVHARGPRKRQAQPGGQPDGNKKSGTTDRVVPLITNH
jgi:hypothetical protein